MQNFQVDHGVLKSLLQTNKHLLRGAESFDGFSRRLMRNMQNAHPFEPYEVQELLVGYKQVQTHNRIHDPEAGQRLAQEIKRWQAAKVRYLSGEWHEKPLLPCTGAQTKAIDEINAWFGL